jgi:hypothetical protein
MGDVTRDATALELLREQRGRLADRVRLPWWGQSGIAIMYALVFAFPLKTRYLPQVRTWPILIAVVAVVCLLQWSVTRATGIKVGFRNLRFPKRGRRLRIAVFVVCLAALDIEHYLIDRGLIAAKVAVAAVALVAELALQQAVMRDFRQELRDGGGMA